jgi:hypothetical protein
VDIERVDCHGELVQVQVRSRLPAGVCAKCGAASARVHSRYHRTLADACGVPARGSVVLWRATDPPVRISHSVCAGHGGKGAQSGTSQRQCPEDSSGAAVFVDQATQYVDPLHRRLATARRDQPQLGSRAWCPQIQAALRSHGVVVP